MALTFMGCSYCKVENFSLIPLNFLDFDTRHNFAVYRIATQIVVSVFDNALSCVLDGEFISRV